MSKAVVINDDCRNVLKKLNDNTIAAIVCDPPYELNFNGTKGWDNTGIAFDVDMWKDCLRVLKPGGHALVFGASRVFHRVAVAMEEAGFEIKVIMPWIYTSGYPKGNNISLSIDKTLGHVREDRIVAAPASNKVLSPTVNVINKGTPVSEEALKWEGWSTQLKNANEPIIVAQKPLSESTVAKNVLRWGTGGLNMDACAVPPGPGETATRVAPDVVFSHAYDCDDTACVPECSVASMDTRVAVCYPAFRYNKKASSKERPFIMQQNCECDAYTFLNKKGVNGGDLTAEQLTELQNRLNEKSDAAEKCILCETPYEKFVHKTVKPLDLIRWMVRLVTPPDGVLFEPFAGTGTTFEAALVEGFSILGTELGPEHIPLIKKRLDPYGDRVTYK